jgi:hypothetical protein
VGPNSAPTRAHFTRRFPSDLDQQISEDAEGVHNRLGGRVELGSQLVAEAANSLLITQLSHVSPFPYLGSLLAFSTASTIFPNDSSSANRCSAPTSIKTEEGNPLFLTNSSESANGTTSSALECKITVFGLTVLVLPHRFQAGQSNTNGVEPKLMFIATAPPRLEPTTTFG